MALTDAPAIIDGTTHAPDVAPASTGTAAISGPTHVSSTGATAPDPTGLRGELQKNFAAAAEKAAAQTNEAKAKPADKPADGVSRETTGERGPDGKFLPKVAAADTAPDEPPSSWRAETKALWNEFAPKLGDAQAKILKDELRKRENDFRSGLSAKDAEVSQIKGLHNEISPLIARHEHLWKDTGISTAKAVENLLTLNANFRRDPVATIRMLAQSAGVDMQTLAAGATQQGGETADPKLAPLYQTINGLQSKLHAIESGMASQTTNAAAAEIQSVIDEKGADGQPLRPHFDTVFPDIQAEIQVLRTQHPDWSARQTATQAYDNAIWRNPDVRQKMIEGISAKTRSSEDAEQRTRAAEAAAKNVRGGPPNALNGAPNTDLRAMLTQGVTALYSNGSRVQ